MLIYTSYFTFVQHHPLPDDIVPIAVCKHPPEGFTGKKCKMLVPPDSWLEQLHDDGNTVLFTQRYTKKLSDLMFCSVMLELQKLMLSCSNNVRGVCLLSFESDTSCNHRDLISEWLRAFGCETKVYAEEIRGK